MAAETMRGTIWLPNHEGYNMAAQTTRDTIWLPHQERNHMAAESRENNMADEPWGMQYGCRNHERYNRASETTRDTIWLPHLERNNMAALLFILPCRKLDEEEVEGQELCQWLLSLGRLCCCLSGRHSWVKQLQILEVNGKWFQVKNFIFAK